MLRCGGRPTVLEDLIDIVFPANRAIALIRSRCRITHRFREFRVEAHATALTTKTLTAELLTINSKHHKTFLQQHLQPHHLPICQPKSAIGTNPALLSFARASTGPHLLDGAPERVRRSYLRTRSCFNPATSSGLSSLRTDAPGHNPPRNSPRSKLATSVLPGISRCVVSFNRIASKLM